MNNFTGIYAFLVWCPIWAVALILYIGIDWMIHIIRDRFEGLGYQVAYSAKIGDAGLIICVLIAETILKRGNLILPGPLTNSAIQFTILVGCFFVCCIISLATLESRNGQFADVYHDLIVAPFMMFFAFTLLPVIYIGGTTIEKRATFFLVLLWVVFVFYDIKADRMNQRRWLKRMCGVKFR